MSYIIVVINQLHTYSIPMKRFFYFLGNMFFYVFTARRYAKRGICRRRVSVCVCVCVSVTLQYCIKTAKHRITQITPYDSPGTLVF